MKWPGRTAWRAHRAAARTTALISVLAASGLAAGVASASGTQITTAKAAAASLTYLCRFPSGPHPVQVAVNASLPAAGKPGKPIQPSGVRLTVTLPTAAFASLHSATVSAATRLTVSASEGPSGTSLVWPGTTRRPVHRPATGTLTLTTAGAVPPVTASSPGEVTLTAAGLSVTLTAGKAAVPAPGPARSSTPTAGGRAAVPAPSATAQPPATARSPLQVNCTLAPGQHAALGAVLVTGKARRAGPTARRRHGKCPKLATGRAEAEPALPAAAPPGLHDRRPCTRRRGAPSPPGTPTCAS